MFFAIRLGAQFWPFILLCKPLQGHKQRQRDKERWLSFKVLPWVGQGNTYVAHRVDCDAAHIHADGVAQPLARSEHLLAPRHCVVQVQLLLSRLLSKRW